MQRTLCFAVMMIIGMIVFGTSTWVRAQDPGSAAPAAPAPAASPEASRPASPATDTIDARIQEYLGASGLQSGFDTTRLLYIGSMAVPVQVQPGKSGFIMSRNMAFGRAEILARDEFVKWLQSEVSAGRQLTLVEAPTATPTEKEDKAVAANPNNLLEKAILLANKKLDASLTAEGFDPASKTLKELAGDRFGQTVKVWATGMARGTQVLKSFEGVNDEGKWCVGVVMAWSPNMQKIADAMLVGKGSVPPAKPGKPLQEQIPTDTDALLATFGVNVLVDEAGNRVLVAYGQAEPSSTLATAGTIAQQKAQLDALAALRQFAGESIAASAVKTDVEFAQSLINTQTGERGDVVTQSQAYQQKVKATSAALNISGAHSIKKWSGKHKAGNKVYGVVMAWSPQSQAQAKVIKAVAEGKASTTLLDKQTVPSEQPAKELDGVSEGVGGSLDAL
ncbi:MAG: hypothetical protein NTV22_01315 [bacterium]|nr:hypothetical protein [bacterium]